MKICLIIVPGLYLSQKCRISGHFSEKSLSYLYFSVLNLSCRCLYPLQVACPSCTATAGTFRSGRVVSLSSLRSSSQCKRAPFDRAESYLFLLSAAAVNALCSDRFHRCHASHALASLLNISLVTSISSPSSYVDDALYSAVMIYPLVFTMFLGADLRLSITSFTT